MLYQLFQEMLPTPLLVTAVLLSPICHVQLVDKMYIKWILLVCLKLFGLMDSKLKLKEARDFFLCDPG